MDRRQAGSYGAHVRNARRQGKQPLNFKQYDALQRLKKNKEARRIDSQGATKGTR